MRFEMPAFGVLRATDITEGGTIVHLGNISLLAGLSWLTARPATGPCAPAINLGVGFNIGD